jgi:glutamate dehydrogenase
VGSGEAPLPRNRQGHPEEEFTVIGVGDMSGDVFGNGMLLSRKIRLLAAFDHRDIFIDPNPKPIAKRASIERKRLFDTPRTSWQDYDKKLISKGGGVFSRSEVDRHHARDRAHRHR